MSLNNLAYFPFMQCPLEANWSSFCFLVPIYFSLNIALLSYCLCNLNEHLVQQLLRQALSVFVTKNTNIILALPTVDSVAMHLVPRNEE